MRAPRCCSTTGNTAFRLGLAKALVPFVFVYSPSMLLVTKGFTWSEFFETTIGCAIGVVMLAVALTGYGLARMPTWERLGLGAASILVISPSRTATLIGLAMSTPFVPTRGLAGRAINVTCTKLTLLCSTSSLSKPTFRLTTCCSQSTGSSSLGN